MFESPETPLSPVPKRAPQMDASTAAPNEARTEGQTENVAPKGDEAALSPGGAAGDATYTTDIPDNAGIALFSSKTNFTLANRLDAVGSTSEANTLYKEGTG